MLVILSLYASASLNFANYCKRVKGRLLLGKFIAVLLAEEGSAFGLMISHTVAAY